MRFLLLVGRRTTASASVGHPARQWVGVMTHRCCFPRIIMTVVFNLFLFLPFPPLLFFSIWILPGSCCRQQQVWQPNPRLICAGIRGLDANGSRVKLPLIPSSVVASATRQPLRSSQDVEGEGKKRRILTCHLCAAVEHLGRTASDRNVTL